jgi:acetoin utilization deacetylase AcuC-like enzyme
VQIAGRAFTLGSVNVAQAVLTAQAHDLVERSALAGRLARITPVAAPEEALLAVHTAAYLRRLREAGAGGPWDGEFAPVTPATWEAARLAVGGVLAAVDAVLDGGIQRALVHARPAGHHAEPDRAIASTYLNNVACGVEHARARGVERVAIIDWDVHVANGAERIFWTATTSSRSRSTSRTGTPPTRAHSTRRAGPARREARSTSRSRPRPPIPAFCSRSTTSSRRSCVASAPT